MKTTNKVLMLAAVAAAMFAVGRSSIGWGAASGAEPGTGQGASEAKEPVVWTCPMHPQIKLPDFVPCPICGMDLVELTLSGDDHPRRLVMSPASKALAHIATEPVRRKNVTRPVRMVGKVDYDETALRTISAWVPGRIDRLYVDYTGVRVQEGDHLVWLYSPDLLTAQEELLSARARVGATAGESSEFLASSNRAAYTSAREKLLLWGLTEAQVVEIEDRGTASDRVVLTSPSTGVVIDKFLDEGAYVQTGTQIYRIADLSELWLRFDAYEQDLAWLRYGQRVVVEVEALPGETLEGTISYIDPFVHEHTRTSKVRVNVDNRDGRLKPGMFVRAVASARIGAGGVVLDRQLAGKWVSPMHPEIVKDGPGQCDVCGMDLVRAEELGLVPDAPSSAKRPLVVPSSAVLVTGKRAVVYVELLGAQQPTYEGREVVLGPRAGDEYMVLEGLEEGERVVTHGAFRIDSSMQIQAKPSMMGMAAQLTIASGPEATAFRASLSPLYQAYLAAQVALAGDDDPAARSALREMSTALEAISAAGLGAEQRTIWGEESAALSAAFASSAAAPDIESLRASFEPVSRAVLTVVRAAGHGEAVALTEAYCPMAFNDTGASWLQSGTEVLNPYFGASMLRCGEIRESFPSLFESAVSAESMPVSGGHLHDEPDVDDPSSTEDPVGLSPLGAVFAGYLDLQAQLARDEADAAHASLGLLRASIVAATGDSTLATSTAERLQVMHAALEARSTAAEIDADRLTFKSLSEQVLAIEEEGGNPLSRALQVVHCPMAFDDTGASWLQAPGPIANPYFGATMLRCGAIVREVASR